MRGYCTPVGKWSCIAVFAIWTVNAGAAAPFLPLYANINDKTPGVPIGTGGAALGEPTNLSNLTTLIAETAPGRNYLQVSNDLSSTVARRTRWQLLGNVNVEQGVLIWSFDFTPSARDSYSFLVREANTSTASFVSINLNSSGNFLASDGNGSIAIAPLTYAANELLHVVMYMDMDAGTSDVLINGDFLYSGRVHGVTGIGVGGLSIGYSSSSSGNAFRLDNVQAIHEQRQPILLNADLEDRPLGMPIGFGGAEVGEPVSSSPQINTLVQSDGNGGRELSYASSDTTTAGSVIWQWLDNIEVLTGQVVIGLDVRFPQRDLYAFYVRESGGSAQSFLSLRTLVSGGLRINDAAGTFDVAEASYVAGQDYRVRMAFDMDNGTYDVLLGDVVLTAGRAHGVTSGRGVGRLLTVVNNGAAINQAVGIDNLRVEASDGIFLLDGLFRNGFE